MSHFRVRAITPKPYGIYLWNFTGAYITIRQCVMNKEDNTCIFVFLIISPWLNSIQLTASGPLLLNRMGYIHETLPVHASHWDDVSWTRKTTVVFCFFNYFPLTRFHIVNRVRAITPKLYGIYSWNFTSACIILIQCVMNKEDNFCIFCFWIIYPCLSCI